MMDHLDKEKSGMTDLPRKRGPITKKIAPILRQKFKSQDFDILSDHGTRGVDSDQLLGKLQSWFDKDDGKKIFLTHLDIALVSRNSNRIIALIEIEETSDNPKLLLVRAMKSLDTAVG